MSAATSEQNTAAASAAGAQREFVSATIGGQWCGIPVLKVQDVLGPQRITRVPLAPPEVAGSLNLRGRIVTSIDLRVRLGLDKGDHTKAMSIVVEHHGELYSLMVDAVGEVLSIGAETLERSPATLDPVWRGVSEGVYRLEKGLLVLLNVENLLDFTKGQALAA